MNYSLYIYSSSKSDINNYVLDRDTCFLLLLKIRKPNQFADVRKAKIVKSKDINHIEQNGYMEDLKDLTKPPFDKPLVFVKLFDRQRQEQLMEILRQIKDNAVSIVA